MIDLKQLRQNSDVIKELILRKEPEFKVDMLLELDKKVRRLRAEYEQLRTKRNELASKGASCLTDQLRAQSSQISKELKEIEKTLEQAEQNLKTSALSCPNIIQSDIPCGTKQENKPIKIVGCKPVFDFAIKNHIELNKKLEWFSINQASQMSGSGFVVYRGLAVKMIYALTQLMLKNNISHGFEPIIPPSLVKEKALINAGSLPKFAGDFYSMPDDRLHLIPTAEVSLTNLHANSILLAEQLPLRYTAWTSCFRREAGGYGATERGLIRIHQFEKVELYSLCQPNDSNNELERMLACAETLLKQLGLHYRVSLLAAQDCSFSAARTYDIEVWLTGQHAYYEVSSASNCTDFQARRSGIRYRKSFKDKPHLVHTLNASSLALPRLIVALMEQYQQSDGTIELPEIVIDAMNKLW